MEVSELDNHNYVRNIANDLNAIARGDYYYCPHCGAYSNDCNDEGDGSAYCTACDEEVQIMTMADYFADCLGVEYRVDRRDADSINSVKVCIAYGGPNIYVDTGTKSVNLYWGADSASYPLGLSACNAINDYFNELWAC